MRLLCVLLVFLSTALASDRTDPEIEKILTEANRNRAQRNFTEAERLYRNALDKTVGTPHAKILNNLGALHYDQARYAEAESLYTHALRLYALDARDDKLNLAVTLVNIGELHRARARYAEAENAHRRALAIREEVLGPSHTAVATSLNSIGALMSDQGRHADAEHAFRRALKIRNDNGSVEDSHYAAIL